MSTFDFGFIVGRFNHIHIGHQSLINKGLKMCENLLVLVGSSQESGTERNPFTADMRMMLLREIYGDRLKVGFLPDTTNENDISHDWGRYVLENVKRWGVAYDIQYDPDVMIFGNDEDRAGWYHPDDISGIAQVILSRELIDISATKLRKAMAIDDRRTWHNYTHEKIHGYYYNLRTQLLKIPDYKEMINHEG